MKIPIRELVTIKALKGQQYVAAWGISLDFVPHVQNGKQLRWHRTNASAHEDLGVDPMDWQDEQRASRLMLARWNVARLSADVARVAAAAIDESARWFDRVRDLESLVPLFEEAISQPTRRFQFDNYTQYRLAYAFVLAAVDRRGESRTQLDAWLAHHASWVSDSVREQLRATLEGLPSTGGQRQQQSDER